jgi:hypothetical protein
MLAASLALLAATLIASMGTYISWVHRQEYASEIASIREQLAEIDPARMQRARGAMRWRVEGKALQW